MKKTKVINFIAGPGAGKTTLACTLFVQLKLKNFVCEYVPEFAKSLVWEENYNLLNDQYYVSKKQFELLNNLNGKVDYIITDASLFQGLFYNINNPENVSNIEKTEKMILNSINKFDNINIFINRHPNNVYEVEGRIQSEKEAKDIDKKLKVMLMEYDMDYIDYKY